MKIKTETSAGGIVYKRNENKWLICQHSHHKGWIFPKGLIGDKETNESMEQAALREVEEEGGVKAKIINPQPIMVQFSYKWQGSPHAKDDNEKVLVDKTVYYFLMEYISGNPKNHDWEMMDAKFVTEKEVKEILTYPSDKEAFEKILKFKT